MQRAWDGGDSNDDSGSDSDSSDVIICDHEESHISAGAKRAGCRKMTTMTTMTLKERERWLEAVVEECWRDVCVIASLGAKMRALRVCVGWQHGKI